MKNYGTSLKIAIIIRNTLYLLTSDKDKSKTDVQQRLVKKKNL